MLSLIYDYFVVTERVFTIRVKIIETRRRDAVGTQAGEPMYNALEFGRVRWFRSGGRSRSRFVAVLQGYARNTVVAGPLERWRCGR